MQMDIQNIEDTQQIIDTMLTKGELTTSITQLLQRCTHLLLFIIFLFFFVNLSHSSSISEHTIFL